MILGHGVDIVNIDRIDDSIKKFGDVFIEKIFTESEIYQAQKYEIPKLKLSFFAKRFAAKESFAKALGSGIGDLINFKDINVVNNSDGKPVIILSSIKKDRIKKHFNVRNFKIDLSLSDDYPWAIASVILSTSDYL